MLLASLGARVDARSDPAAPQVVLSAYENALAKIAYPKNVSFEYSVEQLGLRNMEQTHRVYRSGLRERDETLVVDGYHLKAPSVRIIAGRMNRYAIERVAPKVSAYAFTYAGAVNESDAYGYIFTTQARSASAYAITQIEIDGRSFLPREVKFRIAGATTHGSGKLQFEQVEKYWVVVSAEVSAHLPHGAIAHETMQWSNYHFPESLPASTFDTPHLEPAVAVPNPPATPPPPVTPDAAAPPTVP